MTPSDVQKLRTAVSLLRTHGENDAADGLLDVIEREPFLAIVPEKDFATMPGGVTRPIPAAHCPHPFLTSRDGATVKPGDEAICGTCGALVGKVASFPETTEKRACEQMRGRHYEAVISLEPGLYAPKEPKP